MDDSKLTSLETTGGVSSRFVSANELDAAKKQKEEQWKAAYARLGQEPPPQKEEEEYDPRSLYEKLHAQKEVKKEQWDEKMKMSNQWRGLEVDELQFLAEVDDEARTKEREQRMKDLEEVAAFKAMQNRGPIPSPPISSTPSSSLLPTASASSSTSTLPKPPMASASSTTKPAPSAKSNLKSKLKGIVVKKKPLSPAGASPSATAPAPVPAPAPVAAVAPPAAKPAAQTKAAAPPPSAAGASAKRKLGGLLGLGSGSDSDSGSDGEGEDEPVEKKAKKA